MPKYLTVLQAVVVYLLTPEDSRETMVDEPITPYFAEIPRWLSGLKSLFCLLLAFALAFLLSRFS